MKKKYAIISFLVFYEYLLLFLSSLFNIFYFILGNIFIPVFVKLAYRYAFTDSQPAQNKQLETARSNGYFQNRIQKEEINHYVS